VIKCWTEGVQRMKVGEKARLTCPSDVAYGDQGRPPQIPGGATLVFDVELLEIVK
jgi:FKBP-type peptidyl-prolyl cis-trans isomerase FkpA